MVTKQYLVNKHTFLSVAVFIALGSMSLNVNAGLNDRTPENFALPFGLEGIQEVNSQAIPNLVFLIDDSKRTGEKLPNGQTKLDSYKKAVEEFIQANRGKYRFGVASLYDIEKDPTQVGNVMKFARANGVMISSAPGSDEGAVLEKLKSLTVQEYENAPIITSLTQVYKEISDKAIVYRCQQSYVFVVSDGDSTGDADKKRLSFPTGDDVIFPETAAFTKMKGQFDPYVPQLRKNEKLYWFLDEKNELIGKDYKKGDLYPKSLLSRSQNYVQSCAMGSNMQRMYSADSHNGMGLCYVQPSPDGYSTYAHFADADKYWDSRGKTHYFDDPEYPVQSIYTSWFSSRKTEVPSPEKVVIATNQYRAELLVSPETMATRGKGYYRFITSSDGLSQSLTEVSQKFKSNPALAMGRYYVPDVLLAGYIRPTNYAGSAWKEEETYTYIDNNESKFTPKDRMKKMPILRAVNYPKNWASAYVYSQLDEQGTGKTEKFPEIINKDFKHNDSFAGRDAEKQMVAFAMGHSRMAPQIINTTKGIKVIADGAGTVSSSFTGFTNITDLSNKEFGIDSNDNDRLKKTWPFYFTLGAGPSYFLYNRYGYPGLSSSKFISMNMYGIRPNTLSMYSTFYTTNSFNSLYIPEMSFDESYEPTTPALENGVIFSNSVLPYGNKQRYGTFYDNNDVSGENGGGTVGSSIGTTWVSGYGRQWTDKHYVFHGVT